MYSSEGLSKEWVESAGWKPWAEVGHMHSLLSQCSAEGRRDGGELDCFGFELQEDSRPPPPLRCFPFLASKQKLDLANWDTMSAWAAGCLKLGGSCPGS